MTRPTDAITPAVAEAAGVGGGEIDAGVGVTPGVTEFLDLDKRIRTREKACEEARGRVLEILSLSEREGREMTTAEADDVEELQRQHAAGEREIQALRTQVEMHDAAAHRRTEPPPLAGAAAGIDAAQASAQPETARPVQQAPPRMPAGSSRVSRPRVLSHGGHGFYDMGQFASAVRLHAEGGGMDGRLAASSAQEGIGADGGFAVPPTFLEEIQMLMFGDTLQSLARYCMRVPIDGNSISVGLDMTTPYAGGTRAYWGGELSTHRSTRPAVEELSMRLFKLTALVYCTDELLSDSRAMTQLITRSAAEAIAWETSEAIVNGNGLKQPLGILHSDALIEQAADASQSADTISASNVANLWSRLLPGSHSSAIWLVSPSAFPQLQSLQLANQPLLMPPGGMRDMPYMTIYGRPVIIHQVAQNLGDKGDIILADFSRYLLIEKAQGMQAATSIHLRFDTDETAFKFQTRLNAASLVSKAIKVKHGAHTCSAFATLAAR